MGRRFIDMIGQKFGRITVIKRMPDNKHGHSRWLCKCDCGTEKVIVGQDLRRGYTKSCGCLRIENGKRSKISLGVASMRAIIAGYKAGAKKRGYTYNLTERQFSVITQKDCFYCGAKPKNIINKKDYNGSYTYNGIDRIDNTKGYTINNTVPCCKVCNRAKADLTLQEFKDWIRRAYKISYKKIPKGSKKRF